METKLKPIIPWMGGKRKMIKYILPEIPEFNGVYYEPFVGAGAVFLSLQPKKAVISDINPDIVNMWKQIKNNPEKLTKSLTSHKINKEHWNKCNKKFPNIRQYTVKRASYFCFLLAYGFGGLYKLRPDGSFKNTFITKKMIGETPFKQQIKNIKNISKYMNSNCIKIKLQDYEKVINKCKKGDMFYLDPPYVSNAKQTKLMYGKNNFDHNLLCKNYKKISSKGVKCILSNVNSVIITKPLNCYKIKKIKLNIQWTLDGKKRKLRKGKMTSIRNEILVINF